ncbi:rRNA biogenesis protein RRP5 isoform X1 [Babesia caballi]|uniref:rRNA biogenesis protein RRP5 isoform X1 n=1 Tax=Babesia caballi TaxID=5871 RepID=A0AAV4M1B1_BABCB|nr:rRNA biogenesis protein RRP5 isoform X1 [Babesia caballi]
MEAEEDFPRSSEVVLEPLGQPRRRNRATSQPASAPTFAASNRAKRSVLAGASSSRGQLPTIENLEAGTLVMGSVAIVAPTGLRVHLPGGLYGFVRSSDAVDMPTTERCRLDSIVAGSLNVGSHVVCSVLEVKNGFAALTMRPSVINKGLTLASLTPGMLLPASVRAHEDHGILLSFGLVGSGEVRGFIPYDEEAPGHGTGTGASSGGTSGTEARVESKKAFTNGDSTTDDSAMKTDKPTKDAQATNAGRSSASMRKLPLHSTVYVVVDSVNVDRQVVSCKWPWRHSIPLPPDCQVPLLSVRPGLLLVGEISDVHYPASAISATTDSRVNYGFDVKCLNGLAAVVPAIHSVLTYSERSPGAVPSSVEEESHGEPDGKATTKDAADTATSSKALKRKRKGKLAASLEVESDAPLGLEDMVVGRVLYVNHWHKTIYVSLLSHLVRWKGPQGHPHRLTPNALKTFGKVVRSIPGHGVVFSICRLKTEEQLMLEHSPEDLPFKASDMGYCEPSHLQDAPNGGADKAPRSRGASAPQLALAYTLGSVHPTVELEFDFLTRLTRLSMKESLRKETLVSPFQLPAGTSVRGTITKVLKTGVSVRLSKLVHGKVPLEHLTDVPLPQVPDRFPVGRAIKLRALRYDHVHSALLLTAKRTFRKDSDPLTSFEQLSVGKEFLGFISRVRRSGEAASGPATNSETVSVRFYNDLQSALDPAEIEEAQRLDVDLSSGAVVRVAVSRVDPRRRVFHVTLSPDKIASLKEQALARTKRRREARRAACKKAFTNYTSLRKRRKAES